MEEYLSGDLLARVIDDDRELLTSYIRGELTPFHLKEPQSFEQSCLPCIHAMDNGQPDPFRCDTDPCPETYHDVVDGYSRHSDCGYGFLSDDEIIARLKRSSFRRNEAECFVREMMDLDPSILNVVHFTTPEEVLTYHRARGVREPHDLARLVDAEFIGSARLTDEVLGRLLPANPGAEISDEGHKRRGHRLRKEYKNSAV